MRIGLDVDGVIADFTAGAREACKIMFGKDLGETVTKWDWMSDVLTKVEEKVFWDTLLYSPFWASLKPLPWARELIEETRWWERVVFITSRARGSESIRKTTALWITEQFGVVAPLVVNAKNEDEKAVFTEAFNLDIFVDDKPENCDAVAKKCPTVDVILLAQPWNTHYSDTNRVSREDPIYFIRTLRGFNEEGNVN